MNRPLVLQGLSYKVLSVPGKKFDSQPSTVFKMILLPTPCCYGLGNLVYTLQSFTALALVVAEITRGQGGEGEGGREREGGPEDSLAC